VNCFYIFYQGDNVYNFIENIMFIIILFFLFTDCFLAITRIYNNSFMYISKFYSMDIIDIFIIKLIHFQKFETMIINKNIKLKSLKIL